MAGQLSGGCIAGYTQFQPAGLPALPDTLSLGRLLFFPQLPNLRHTAQVAAIGHPGRANRGTGPVMGLPAAGLSLCAGIQPVHIPEPGLCD